MNIPDRYRMDLTEKGVIGARLKKARKASGYSIAQAAEAVGLKHRNTVTTYERGHRMASLQVFAALCRLYGVPMDDVWFGNSKTGLANRSGG
jgi:transcriptional regulator with XRE-family HTH domain